MDPAEGGNRAADDGDYDLLPYLSLPISYTDPSRMAALATLLAIDPPRPSTARVVELGCAGGGNLVPLAARYPAARFTGYDLSARQIDSARARARALRLDNVRFEQADIASLELEPGSVDYLVCHGVFSWVPAAVQDAILRLAARCLSATGVAAVSYNVLPGWHLRSPIRDALLHYAGQEGSPQERVAKAREVLHRLETGVSARHGYGAIVKAEAVRMARMPSSYLMGEFLAATNAPISFPQMLARAAREGLAFLAEADLSAGACDMVGRTARPAVGDLTGPERQRVEVDLDILSGRPFRRSLLIRAAAAQRVSPPGLGRLGRLHASAELTPSGGTNGHRTVHYLDAAGRTVSSASPEVGAMLARLSGAFPGTVPVADVLAAGGDGGGARVARALLDLVGTGRAHLSAEPLEVGRATDAYPTVWPLARWEAARKPLQPHLTGQTHVAVMVPPAGQALAARMTGRASRKDLLRWLGRQEASGMLAIPSGEGVTAEAFLDETLRLLERGGVLLRSHRDPTIAAS